MNRIHLTNVADASILHHHDDDINLLHLCNLYSACLDFCLILMSRGGGGLENYVLNLRAGGV